MSHLIGNHEMMISESDPPMSDDQAIVTVLEHRNRQGLTREVMRAWQHLVTTGLAWTLGDRTIRLGAESMIRRGIVTDRRRPLPKGVNRGNE